MSDVLASPCEAIRFQRAGRSTKDPDWVRTAVFAWQWPTSQPFLHTFRPHPTQCGSMSQAPPTERRARDIGSCVGTPGSRRAVGRLISRWHSPSETLIHARLGTFNGPMGRAGLGSLEIGVAEQQKANQARLGGLAQNVGRALHHAGAFCSTADGVGPETRWRVGISLNLLSTHMIDAIPTSPSDSARS